MRTFAIVTTAANELVGKLHDRNRRTRSRSGLALAVLLATTPALSQPPSEAENIAARTGEVIGGASACGISDAELIALGRKVIAWARDAARSASELRRAQAAHEAAVSRGAARLAKAGHGACDATVASFKALEREER